MKVLSYKDWRYFDAVIEKAKIACQNSETNDNDHFVVSNKMVEIGSGAKREPKDNMGSEELAANLFRITQTESRLKRDKVNTEKKACDTHNKIGKIVRKAIDISNIEIINYVAVDEELVEIPLEVISLSKNLSKLKGKMSI